LIQTRRRLQTDRRLLFFYRPLNHRGWFTTGAVEAGELYDIAPFKL
jgi:hypothetical protein